MTSTLPSPSGTRATACSEPAAVFQSTNSQAPDTYGQALANIRQPRVQDLSLQLGGRAERVPVTKGQAEYRTGYALHAPWPEHRNRRGPTESLRTSQFSAASARTRLARGRALIARQQSARSVLSARQRFSSRTATCPAIRLHRPETDGQLLPRKEMISRSGRTFKRQPLAVDERLASIFWFCCPMRIGHRSAP
jgi:hypothetical protein